MSIDFGKDVIIEKDVVINVTRGKIGDRSIIRSGARIEGTYVELGTESYLDHGAWIGGGSCFDSLAYLSAGDWLHMGWNSQINIARGVEIGSEVGIGIETKIFTHGAYPPIDMGFPVQWGPVMIGSRVWLPHAWVNPNVIIGDNVVVAAMSLVTKNLPSGCLAGGIPANIIKLNKFPEKIYVNFEKLLGFLNIQFEYRSNRIVVEDTIFDIDTRVISGPATLDTEIIKNQLRRNGIRFRYTVKRGEYVPWSEF